MIFISSRNIYIFFQVKREITKKKLIELNYYKFIGFKEGDMYQLINAQA